MSGPVSVAAFVLNPIRHRLIPVSADPRQYTKALFELNQKVPYQYFVFFSYSLKSKIVQFMYKIQKNYQKQTNYVDFKILEMTHPQIKRKFQTLLKGRIFKESMIKCLISVPTTETKNNLQSLEKNRKNI